ncbi:hypothetical protein GCM10011383_44710 [Hymenobacter cavernae]|uniref:Uncharacterized protein n=1 Tax=Hymenobacter cavernae TaxID=2044852 RepID=A0ABQ1UWN0_9BACT|nr:hypothetical protein GCM10011383_44710 [Hymenobacter cavernae]
MPILAHMSWTVILEDENKHPIASLSEEFRTGVNLDNEAFRMLRYLDPYGNTTFNRLQQQELLTDLRLLRELEPRPVVDELITLLTQSQEQVHTYVCFYGD